MTLTKTLKTVESILSDISSEIASIFQQLHEEEDQIIEQILTERNIPESQWKQGREEILQVLEGQVSSKLDEAQKLVGRFLTVTRKISDISKKTEMWERIKSDIKKLIFESEWYKKRSPIDYERRRRQREYPWSQETYRRWLPEREETEEYWQEREHRRHPEESKIEKPWYAPASIKQHIVKMGSASEIRVRISKLVEEVVDLTEEFFDPEGPIVTGADNIRDYLIKLNKSGLLDKLSKIPKIGDLINLFSGKKEKGEAISELIRIIENVLGYHGRPGQYVTLGEKAFLRPLLLELQDASAGLENVTARGLEYPSKVIEELEEEIRASTTQFSRRLGFQRRRDLRSWLLRKLTQSHNKEDFNG